MPSILYAVGEDEVNRYQDVLFIQRALNKFARALGFFPLDPSGELDDETIEAIELYQEYIGLRFTDGVIHPTGKTIKALRAAPTPAEAGSGEAGSNLSGAAWWQANQAKYPNSSSVDDLAPGFRFKTNAFLKALRDAKATVKISATRRNKTRAYLMHYCWLLSKGTIKASEIPHEEGCDIKWDHGNAAKSQKAAEDMVKLFAIKFQPSLTSHHIAGKAIDMDISWSGSLIITDAKGKEATITGTANGSNATLHRVGASYGVIKLVSDPPHWSEDGH